jgi:hypothetical protein
MTYYVLDTNILVFAVRNSPIWTDIQQTYQLTPANTLLSKTSTHAPSPKSLLRQLRQVHRSYL